MSLQSTVSHKKKSDLPIAKEISFSPVEKQIQQNNNLISDEELLMSPKFGTILSHLHELQSQSTPSKNTHHFQSQNNPLWDRHCKNHCAASDYSLVNQQKDETINDSLVEQSDLQPQSEQQLIELKTQESSDEVMPISLDGLFIKDTLAGINNQQNLAFEMTLESTSAKAITGSVDSLIGLNPSHTQSLVHIEVQAASIAHTNLMTEQQQQAIAMAIEEIDEREGFEEDQLSNFEKKNSLIDNKKDQKVTSESLSKIVEAEATIVPQTNTPMSTQMLQSLNINNLTNHTLGTTQGQINLDTSFSESLKQSGLDKMNTLMQVKDHFQSMLKNQQTHLKVNLMPQDLGGIEITIDLSKETVMATLIRAERRETMELLAKYAQDINQLFHDAGLQANLADMNFTSDQDLPHGLHENTSLHPVSLQMNTEDTQASQDDIDPDALVDIKA